MNAATPYCCQQSRVLLPMAVTAALIVTPPGLARHDPAAEGYGRGWTPVTSSQVADHLARAMLLAPQHRTLRLVSELLARSHAMSADAEQHVPVCSSPTREIRGIIEKSRPSRAGSESLRGGRGAVGMVVS